MKKRPGKKNCDHQPLASDHLEIIRKQLVLEAQKAYEHSGIKGLCAEGRWECALDAMRTVKLDESATETEL